MPDWLRGGTFSARTRKIFFNFEIQRDEFRNVGADAIIVLTAPDFCGISSRACGPCRIAPGASKQTNPQSNLPRRWHERAAGTPVRAGASLRGSSTALPERCAGERDGQGEVLQREQGFWLFCAR